VFPKLVAVVVALGACGCTLLALRQSRLQVASEIAQTQIRINREDERLWVLRARIAERVTPEQVERLAEGVDLRPLVPPVIDEKAKAAMEIRLAKDPATFVGPIPTRTAPQAKPQNTATRPKPRASSTRSSTRVARSEGRR
jgi:hypothetical protein